MNFHFGKDLGAKLWPEMRDLIIFKKKKEKETMNLVFVVTYVASPPFPTFFLLLKPTHAKEKQFFTLHCILYFMK